MSQLPLAFEFQSASEIELGRNAPSEEAGGNDSDTASLEEKMELVIKAGPAAHAYRPALAHGPRLLSPWGWPAGLSWDDAIAYSAVSPAQMNKWIKAGVLVFRKVGRNGARVVLRSQLDEVMAGLFQGGSSIGEDFDFG